MVQGRLLRSAPQISMNQGTLPDLILDWRDSPIHFSSQGYDGLASMIDLCSLSPLSPLLFLQHPLSSSCYFKAC